MNYKRLSALAATIGLAVLLPGCVVVPVDPGPVAVDPSRPGYVRPAPMVVAPAPGYYYRPYRHRSWRSDPGLRPLQVCAVPLIIGA